MSEDTSRTPDRDYMEKVFRERADVKHLGIEMMDRWNWFEKNMPLFSELAVMGHQDGDEYRFIIEMHGETFEFTVKHLPG
jgi:hypothetical protein